jgi:hypothetical protein
MCRKFKAPCCHSVTTQDSPGGNSGAVLFTGETVWPLRIPSLADLNVALAGFPLLFNLG